MILHDVLCIGRTAVLMAVAVCLVVGMLGRLSLEYNIAIAA